ncbi:MAG TPA: cupredoxin family copper-binding protein [Xanthobacteraceae bacterium]
MRARNGAFGCVLAASLAAGVIAGAAGLHVLAAHAADTEVKIDNFAFLPQRLAVKAGTTVTWMNADDSPHTVVSESKLFKSKALDTDDRFSFTFTTPGVYAYFCSVHPHMTGTVVVEAATGSSMAQ